MKRSDNTYTPGEEAIALVRRYLSGDRSDDVTSAINELMMADAGFAKYFRSVVSRSAKNGKGNTWSVGTHGSRSTGSNDSREVGGWSKNSSTWNQRRNERAGYNGSPTSPGGFKASGRDEDSALRRSGEMTPDAVLNEIKATSKNLPQNFAGGRKSWSSAKKAADGGYELNGRRYTPEQVAWIVKRGLSGATMNWSDQAIYDRYVIDQKERKRSESEAKAADIAAKENARKEIERQRLAKEADAADILKRQRDLADWKTQEDYKAAIAAKKSATEAQAKAEREEADRLTFNRTYGIPDDVVLTNEDMKAIRDGKAYYGLSKKDKENKKRLEEELDRIISDPSTPLSSLDKIYERVDQIKDRFHNRVRDREEEDMTPDESFGKRIVTARLKDGREIEGWVDEKGNFTPFPDAKDKLETWNGLTVKDFIKATPSTRETENELKENVPLVERISEGLNAWNMRDSYNQTPESMSVDPVDPAVIIPTWNYRQDSQGSQPTETSRQTNWREFFGNPEVELSSQENRQESLVEKCPVCGADLDVDGVCDVCGYPDKELSDAWKQANA